MKKAIDWFALAVGVALALSGARWMWNGWDIVQAERGWAAFIAGSVMLSGGVIVAVLAWAIMRLTSLPAPAQRALSADDAPAAPFARSTIAPPAAVVAGAGAIVAGATAAVAVPFRDAQIDAPPPKSPVDDAPPPAEAPPPPPPPLPHAAPPAAPPTVGELLRMSEDRAARETRDKTFEAPEGAIEPPSHEPPSLELTPHARLSSERSVVEPPAIAEREREDEKLADAEPVKADEPPRNEPVALATEPPPLPQPPAPEAPPVPEPPAAPKAADEPVYDDWIERTARELGRETPAHDEPAPEPPPPPPPKPEPAVVGRYSSGDTNYLMFADGSIEAQTPEGVMRFASLTELKRFVEKRN